MLFINYSQCFTIIILKFFNVSFSNYYHLLALLVFICKPRITNFMYGITWCFAYHVVRHLRGYGTTTLMQLDHHKEKHWIRGGHTRFIFCFINCALTQARVFLCVCNRVSLSWGRRWFIEIFNIIVSFSASLRFHLFSPTP